jgi:hypothetical protein
MNQGFAAWELMTVWAGAMALGALTLHLVNLIRDRGLQVEVSASTLLIFSIAAWGAWALNAVAATLVVIQPLLDLSLPFNPWVLGAAVSPMALPLGQVRRVLAPVASEGLSSHRAPH